MTAPQRLRPASTAYVAPHPLTGWRGALARRLFALAGWIAGTTPCPTCQGIRRRVGSGGRAAERRAMREAWKAGRIRS